MRLIGVGPCDRPGAAAVEGGGGGGAGRPGGGRFSGRNGTRPFSLSSTTSGCECAQDVLHGVQVHAAAA